MTDAKNTISTQVEIYVPNSRERSKGCKVNVWVNGKNTKKFYESLNDALNDYPHMAVTSQRVAWDMAGVYYQLA